MSTNNLPAQTQAPAPIQVGLTDSQSFELAQRVAKCFAASTLVPKAYQNNLPNCVIALNMAGRMGADPMMVMQNLYVVHGAPSWSAQFLIATFNQSGKFSSIRYDFFGTEGQDDWGCRAKATELSTGELLTGPLVTIGLAKKEGWYQKSGSKWQTMPEQMLRYRAAAWFVRTIAPEIAMGLQTAEEMHDTYEMERSGESFVLPAKGMTSNDLNAMLHAEPETALVEVQPSEQTTPEPTPIPQPEGNGKRRYTAVELEEMRADMVAELEAKGVSLDEVQKAVDCFANRWMPKHIEKIRADVLPELLGVEA